VLQEELSMPMNNEERDKLLMEIHADTKVMASTVKELAKDVWGNGKPGLREDVVVIKKDLESIEERYDKCPARQAHSIDRKRLNVSIIALILAGITTAYNVVHSLMQTK